MRALNRQGRGEALDGERKTEGRLVDNDGERDGMTDRAIKEERSLSGGQRTSFSSVCTAREYIRIYVCTYVSDVTNAIYVCTLRT